MNLIQVVVFCIFVIGVRNWNTCDERKVNIAVYYESLCPDSKRFVRDQLLPHVQRHPDHVKVSLIPFGKASSVSANRFICQHGPNECAGNMFQDCALYMMRNHSDLAKVKYVNCELISLAGVNGNFKCVNEVPNLNAQSVAACVRGNLGVYLQKQSEIATFKVQKPLSFVPTITIDGVFNQRLQDASFHNLDSVCALRMQTNSSMTNNLL